MEEWGNGGMGSGSSDSLTSDGFRFPEQAVVRAVSERHYTKLGLVRRDLALTTRRAIKG